VRRGGRGGFADGEVLHLGATQIDLDAVRRVSAPGRWCSSTASRW
jgi:hypothetical protein